jgi:phenylacetate-CoA ligase
MSVTTHFAGFMKRHALGPSLIRRNPFLYGRTRAVVEQAEHMDLAQRRAWAEQHLQRTLRMASRTRYGRSVGGGQDLASWPMLDKERLRGNLSSFTTGNTLFSAPAVTGGTTGIPLRLVRSMRGVVFEQACLDWLIERLGADPVKDRVALLRGDNIKDPTDIKPPHWVSNNGGKSMVFSSNMLVRETIVDYVKALQEYSPTMLCAYPTSLECLCRLINEHKLKLHIPCVLTSSEVLKSEARRLARDTLGCELIDYYGQAERVAFAHASAPREYRFMPTYSHVELVPYKSDQLGDSAHVYEIVGTTYWNDLMPLVRYRTGDLVRLPDEWGPREIEEVALGLRPFNGVLGREQEILVCPKGVRLTGIDNIPRRVDRHDLLRRGRGGGHRDEERRQGDGDG